MPRPKAPGAPEPKKRSRTGCWNCKGKKVKCGEEKPRCSNCDKNNEEHCDYSIRLNWGSTLGKRRGPETSDYSDPGTPGSTTSSLAPGMGTMSFAIETGRSVPSMARSNSHVTSRSPAAHLLLDDYTRSGSPTPTASTYTLDASSPTLSTPSSMFGMSQLSPQVRPSGPHPSNPAKRPRHGSISEPIMRIGSGYEYTSAPAVSHIPHFTNPYTNEPLDPLLYTDNSATMNGDDSMPPPTSARSSVTLSVDGHRKMSVAYDPDDDPRRMSVNSLLIKEETEAKKRPPTSSFDADDRMQPFGIDRGLPDLDIPRNNDQQVLDVTTPVMAPAVTERRDSSTEFGFSSTANSVAGYTQNLHVKISKTLLPLPDVLLKNPMNLMYFHFFMEHTARILVPHDCPANPFRIILPQMAVRDDDLLYLLLAYSASHRARLLNHKEPANRIAFWVSDVFTHLRLTLEDPSSKITPANVAAAVMLASMEIVAPGSFGVEIPWQKHLSIARQMIAARGGSKAIAARDRVSHFLIRWFAYLDILGNFSSTGINHDSLMFSHELYQFNNENEDYSIDCMLGFSGFLAGVLARIADLSRLCDVERLTSSGDINDDWRPGPAIVDQAKTLKEDLGMALSHRYTLCPHRHSPTESESVWEATEMAATNTAYHWAGLVHLYRRILGLPMHSEEVQTAVVRIVDTIYRVRKGGSAEACLIFPLITAGCQTEDKAWQVLILERVKSVEASGMTQVQKARKLLERVWETGQPWETLVHGEFFG